MAWGIGDELTGGATGIIPFGNPNDPQVQAGYQAGIFIADYATLAVAAVVGAGSAAGPAEVADAKVVSRATVPYQRPSGATTAAQRRSVQGKPCVKCGTTAKTQVAGHKKALVQEHHETGSIDKANMRSLGAIQPECPTCSAKEGLEMSRYSREMNKTLPPPPPPPPTPQQQQP